MFSSTNSPYQDRAINDLALLCNILKPVASECRALGFQLGVEEAKIRTIMANNRYDCEAKLREIISERLKQDSPLTWHAIVTALSSLSVNHPDLVRHIESWYKSPSFYLQQHPSSDLQQHLSLGGDRPYPMVMMGLSTPNPMGLSTREHPNRDGLCGGCFRIIIKPVFSCLLCRRGPPHREQPPTQMMGVRGTPHGENFQLPTLMMGQTQVGGLPHGENFQPPTQIMGQKQVSGPPYGENLQSPTQMMGQKQVRGPPYGENFRPPTQMMGQKQVTAPPHVENSQPSRPYSQAQEFPDRVAQGTSQYGTHPPKEIPYIDVVDQHSDVLTETISGDLTFFINKFLELGFVARTATDNVLSQHGVGNGEKAGQLLSLLTACYNRTHNKEKWFDKFVGVFSSDPAYENLANRITVALEKMKRSDFGSSATVPQTQLVKSTFSMSSMDTFVHYVKSAYKQCKIERNLNVLKWPPTPSKIFINLACIDWESVVSKEEADEYTRAMVEDGNVDVIMMKKTNIDFDDIVRDLPPLTASEKVVLVEGAPGVGKSTFAWEFCRRWERGEIAQQYQLVLLLRLRDERMSKAKSLKDLIYHPSESVCQAVVNELESTFGVNTLIILEGFDELSGPQRKEPSIFLQLILGQLLLHATIMITSRPWATGALLAKFKHRVFLHVEILGFTEENITKYVTSVCTGESKKTASTIDRSVGGPDEVSEEAQKNIDDVMAYISKYPQIKACMYIPLNAAIVVSIYRESMKSKWVLPKTLTELYQALTRILLLRHLCGHAEFCLQKWSVKSFEDLPEEVYTQLLVISKIAYKGICTDGGESFQQSSVHPLEGKFGVHEASLMQSDGQESIQIIFPDLPDDFETLGLMQSVSQLFMDGQKTSHNFLHLTFQEFLAAFLISTMSSAEQLEHFQRHKDGRLRVVLRFLAGLTKLNKVTPDELRSLLGEPTLEQIDEHQTPYSNLVRPDVCVSAHHTNWLFEAQNSELLQSLFHNHTASFTFTRGMLPLEYYSVGYCIAHSHSKWSLTFDEDTKEEKLHTLVSGAKTGDGDYRVAVKTTSMTSESMNILVNGFSSHVEELYYLKIPDNGNSLSLPTLPTLHILELQVDNNESPFNISCDLSLSSLEALIISSSCKGTTLGAKTCEAIGKLLSSTTSLKEFHLSPNTESCEHSAHVNNKHMEVITKGLSDNIALPLKSLDIDCKCTFTTAATRSLVQFITRSTLLQCLKIHVDTLENADIFAKGLSDNIALSLKSLDIDCKCTFTTTATTSLVQFITRSTVLQCLKIRVDTLENADIFAKGLSDNIALPLKSLVIDCKCTFTTTATTSLVQFITRSTVLQCLKIHVDTLENTDIFAKSLSDNIALPLKSLVIDCKCTFTTTATTSLLQFIRRSTTLQCIRIYHATLSVQRLTELTDACSRLQEKQFKKLTFHVECSGNVDNLSDMIRDHPDCTFIFKALQYGRGYIQIPHPLKCVNNAH